MKSLSFRVLRSRGHIVLGSLALVGSLQIPIGIATAEDFYSVGGWSTLHRSGANRKLVTTAPLSDDYRVWTALEGASVLTAPTMSPDGKTLYVTTGQARGAHNLHALTIEGALKWRADAYTGAFEGVDPCAILSSPIIDREGDIYVSDCNELFAFRPDGSIKWRQRLPAPQDGDWQPSEDLPINAFTTAVFTSEGDVFGVTNFGDVVVVDRETGQSRAAPFRLPGLVPSASTAIPMPESLFSDGLVDPEVRDWSWQLLFGGSMRSANTPAIELESGRIFVAATSTSEGQGALYGIDLVESESGYVVEVAFATDMGPGSGSSPSLSPAGDRVYVSDENGLFYSVDARTGEIQWRVETKSASAAAAVGANGDIYSLQAFGPALVAISASGDVKWQSDLDALAAEHLPSSWLLGDPVAIGSGNPTVVGDDVLVPVLYGYETQIGRRIPWAVESFIVVVDGDTGRGLRDVVALADDSTGITALLPDGTIVSSLGTAITSGLAPLARLEWLLPGDRTLIRTVGGIQVSIPATSP